MLTCLVLATGCEPRDIDAQLMKAVVEQDTDSIARLIRSGANPSAPLHDGWTATVIAARERKHAALGALLENGADPNVGGGSRYTPIMWAVFKNDENAVHILLGYGADPCQKTTDGVNAIDVAIKEGLRHLVNVLPQCET